jgi:hypothetical protein
MITDQELEEMEKPTIDWSAVKEGILDGERIARTDVPRLIAEVRRLKAQVEMLREAVLCREAYRKAVLEGQGLWKTSTDKLPSGEDLEGK